jgi:hypothetical protein
MRSRYDITALPSLGELGSDPPLTGDELLNRVADRAHVRPLVEMLFLEDDLLQRESFLAGQSEDIHPVVLTPDQVRSEVPLPPWLELVSPEGAVLLEVDRLWDAYFRLADRVARREQSRFLIEWVAFEVGLRNALVSVRARRLELNPRQYLVAEELGLQESVFAGTVAEWGAAVHPLAGLQVLMAAKWDWVGQHDAWFSFSNDEFAAYAARLILLARWQRVNADRGVRNAERVPA